MEEKHSLALPNRQQEPHRVVIISTIAFGCLFPTNLSIES